VDEAHHLEDASTSALSYRVTRSDIERLFEELGSSNSGNLGQLLTALSNQIKPAEYSAVARVVEKVTDLAYRAQMRFNDFFKSIEDFLFKSAMEMRWGLRPTGTGDRLHAASTHLG
jgi:DNA polymerase-3 subunit epsilon/ATP-dependent DNA helicase DinG